MGHRPQLESLLSKVNEAAPEKPQVSRRRELNTAAQRPVNVVCSSMFRLKYLICVRKWYCVNSRMTLEQEQVSAHLLQTSTDTFSNWLKSTAATARRHSTSSPRSYRQVKQERPWSFCGLVPSWRAHAWANLFLTFTESAGVTQRALGVRPAAEGSSHQVVSQQRPPAHLHGQPVPSAIRAGLRPHLLHQVLRLRLGRDGTLHHSAPCAGHQPSLAADPGPAGPHPRALWVQLAARYSGHEGGGAPAGLSPHQVRLFLIQTAGQAEDWQVSLVLLWYFIKVLCTPNYNFYFSSKCFFLIVSSLWSYNRDHPEATQQMNDLIIAKVSAALKGHWANPDLVGQPCSSIFEVNASKNAYVVIWTCPCFPNRSVTCSMKCCYSRTQFPRREDAGSCGYDAVRNCPHPSPTLIHWQNSYFY